MRISDWSSDVCSSDLIKFSLRFTIALALAGEETGSLDVYSAEMAGRQDLVALRDRIRVQADEALGRNETEVIAHQTDGTVLRERADLGLPTRSEEHTSELPSLMRVSYAVFCLKKKTPVRRCTTRIRTS